MLPKGSKRDALRMAAHIVVYVCLICAVIGVGGCAEVQSWTEARRVRTPYHQQLAATYEQIKVNKSLTLDVLPKIDALREELVSQTESSVAAVGQSPDGYRTWFTLVAFHEYNLTATRKYFFLIDEKAKSRADRGLRFDCEIALEKDDLGSAADENQRKVTMLKTVLEHLRKDIEQLGGSSESPNQANKMLDIGGLTIKQTFGLVLLKLEASPVLISRLADNEGIEFDHVNFDKGRIRLVVEGNIAKVKLRLGALANNFADGPTPLPASSTVSQKELSTQTAAQSLNAAAPLQRSPTNQ